MLKELFAKTEFDEWWNRGSPRSVRQVRPKTESTWALIRAGRLDCIDLNTVALLQLAAFLLLFLLVGFLIYLLYDSWLQSREEVAISSSGAGKPSGRVTYITKDQFLRERARQKRMERSDKQFPVAVPPAAPQPVDNSVALYKYPPRRVL